MTALRRWAWLLALGGCAGEGGLAEEGESEGEGDGGAPCKEDQDCPPGRRCIDGDCGVAGGPRIEVDPPLLDFGAPQLGEAVTLDVEVRNVGGEDLHVSLVAIIEDDLLDEFTSEPSGGVMIAIEPGGATTISVTLSPADGEADGAEMGIASDDPDYEVVTVDLVSEIVGEAAICFCALAEPGLDPLDDASCTGEEAVDLGAMATGESRERDVAIWNCPSEDGANATLVVDSAEIETAAAFAALFSADPFIVDGGAEEPAAFPLLLAPVSAGGGPLFVRVSFGPAAAPGPTPAADLRFVSNEGGDVGVVRDVPIVGVACDAGAPELCNGVDDDCDGDVDESFPLGDPCDGPDGDACDEGVIVCDGDDDVICDDATPTDTEECDGEDDDCDGAIDEDFPLGAPCDGADGDSCTEGVWICAGDGTAACDDATGTTAETCNGDDDDCDGATDEGSNGCGGVCALPAAPGDPCDGTDADFCEDGVWACDGANGALCSDGEPALVEICNGFDDDCDGTPDDGLDAVPCDGPDADICEEGTCLAGSCSDSTGDSLETCNGTDDDCDGLIDEDLGGPPADCNEDGDGLPDVACDGPSPAAADDVRCVCASPPCAASECDASDTSVAAALAALGTVTAPSHVMIFAGTYAGFTVDNAGTSASSPLTVAARCAGGVRDAVEIDDTVTIDAPYVRLEGLRVDMGAVADPAVEIAGDGDYATVRHVTATGTALSTSTLDDYLRCDGSSTNLVDGLLVEYADLYGGDSTAFSYGGYFDYCPGAVVRWSSACRLYSSGTAWYVTTGSAGVVFDRTLAREAYDCFEVASSGATALVLDGVTAYLCSNRGANLDNGVGHSVRHSVFRECDEGVYVDGADADVFDNLFWANTTYGLQANPSAGDLVVPRVSWNTFVDNGATGFYANGSSTYEIAVGEFVGNLLVGHDASGAEGVRREYTSVAVAAANLYWNNTFGTAENCTCTGTYCGLLTECPGGGTGVEVDPLFVTSGTGLPYYLSQPPDQGATSPALDYAAAAASVACAGGVCLDSRTTSTSGATDTGAADVGFHRAVCP